MASKEIIEEFFEEQFNNTSPFFLYKDKQLLKQGKLHQYAEEQISKANKTFIGVSFSIVLCVWYSISFLIEYGANPNWFDLTIGLVAMGALLAILFYACKEYYTVKSSMTMLIKLLNEKDTNKSF